MGMRRNKRIFKPLTARGIRRLWQPKRFIQLVIVFVMIVSVLPSALIISLLSNQTSAVTLNQGPFSAQGTADCVNATGIGTVAWSNAGQASAADTSYATASVDGTITNYIKCTNYGFSIPTGATIDGITVTMFRFASSNGNGGSTDAAVRLVKTGVIGTTDRSSTAVYETSLSSSTHGSGSDLWGATWTAADINASNFGVAFAATKPASAGAAHTVSVADAQVTVRYSFTPTFQQSSYRWFENQDSASPVNVGAPLGGVAQDTGAVFPGENTIVRLRMNLHVLTSTAPTGYFNFKLQYAARGADNLCDTSFTNESYADVTADTPIAYGNNPLAAHKASLTSNANDPTHSGHTKINQEYGESNNVSIVSAVSSGQDAMWDFALKDNGAPASTTYCLRIVTSGSTILANYAVIPQISTGAPALGQDTYRWYKGQGAATNNSFVTVTESSEYKNSYKTIQSSDGGHLIIGSTGPEYYDVLLTKYDTNGNVAWSTTWGKSDGDEEGMDGQQTSDGGYIVTGYTSSYGFGNNDAFLSKYSSSGALEWTRLWGSSSGDRATAVIQTSDNGYVMVGNTASYGAGSNDAFISKWDADGALSWSRTWGGAAGDFANDVTQLSDGGYAITGITTSYGAGGDDAFVARYNAMGDLIWNKAWGGGANDRGSAIVTSPEGGIVMSARVGNIIHLIKWSADGNTLWSKTWGNSGSNEQTDLIATSDGGYAMAGTTSGYGAGLQDMFISKWTTAGDLTWSRTLGTSGSETGQSLAQTNDGGYVVSGISGNLTSSAHIYSAKYDSDGKISGCAATMCMSLGSTGTATATTTTPSASVASPSAGSSSLTPPTSSATLTVVPVVGTMTFATAWGGGSADTINGVIQTSDGGYAVTGTTVSYGGGLSDMFIAKYSSSGALSWSRTWGGASDDTGEDIIQTSDGGFAVSGKTQSYAYTYNDAYVAKYTSTGTLSWSSEWESFSDTDEAYSIAQTSDGGYVVSGELTNPFYNGKQAMLAKLNPSGNLTWVQSYGDYDEEGATAAVQTADGGYIMTGYTGSPGYYDMFLAKFDSAGLQSWSRTWSGMFSDVGYDVIQTSDGGYMVVGNTESFGVGVDVFLVKYDSKGGIVWQRTWGSGFDQDLARGVIQTDDGGFAVTGSTSASGRNDALLLKYGPTGTFEFAKTFGGEGGEQLNDLAQTTDRGYIAAGFTTGYGAGNNDGLVLKFNSLGEISGCSSPQCQSPTPDLGTPTGTPSTLIMAQDEAASAYSSSPTANTSSPSATATTLTAKAIWGIPQAALSTPLASANTAAASSRHDDPLRLRMVLSASGKAITAAGVTMKLQVAPKVGTCDTAFIGEVYVDVGSGAPFNYYDTPSLTSGQFAIVNSTDPSPTTGTRLAGNYIEASNFTNRRYIASGQGEQFDISLTPNDNALYSSYCFRVVKSDNSQLATYTNIMELSIPPAASQQLRYGKFFNEQGGEGLTPYYW